MALKCIELGDGEVRDVNSVEQMYQIDVKVGDEPPNRTQYFEWGKAAAAYREALSNPNLVFADLAVYKFEFMLEGEEIIYVDCD